MSTDFTTVTEIAGDEVTAEQVERAVHRYIWAGQYCAGKDVLEIACGNGQGLGYLASVAKSLRAGDIDKNLVERAGAYYGDRIAIDVMDAQDLPFEDNSLDVVLLYEALYYIPEADKFMTECKRVLRNDGHILIVTANKDLSDFNPSPHSHVYFGAVELNELMQKHGFSADILGYWPLTSSGFKEKVLRPVKKLVVASGLMPKTMAGKKLIKRLVFGELVSMPAEISGDMIDYVPPDPIGSDVPDRTHKVIYCAGSCSTK